MEFPNVSIKAAFYYSAPMIFACMKSLSVERVAGLPCKRLDPIISHYCHCRFNRPSEWFLRIVDVAAEESHHKVIPLWTKTAAMSLLQICAYLQQYFFKMLTKHYCEMAAFPLNDVMWQTIFFFLLLFQVILRSVAIDALNFGTFISIAAAALTIIILSLLLQRFLFSTRHLWGFLVLSLLSAPMQLHFYAVSNLITQWYFVSLMA